MVNGFSLVLRFRGIGGTVSVHTFFFSGLFLYAAESAWKTTSGDVVFIVISCLFLQIFAISETSHSGIVSDVCQLFSILVLLGWMAYVTSFFFLFRFFQIQSTEFGFRPVLSMDYPFSLPTIIIWLSNIKLYDDYKYSFWFLI